MPSRSKTLFALAVLVSVCGCSPVGFIVGGIAAAASSGGDSSTPTGPTPIDLQVKRGSTPGSTQALTVDTDVVVLQFSLEADAWDVDVTEVRFHATGSGNDLTGIPAARLHLDANSDGALDVGDVQIGGGSSYSADDGDLAFTGLTETVAAGTVEDWLLVYDIGPGPVTGDIFCAALPDAPDVVARVGARGALVDVEPGIQACVTVGTGNLALSIGPFTPPARPIGACAQDVELLQVRLTAGPEEDIDILDITFTASGSGDDAGDLASVRLYSDDDSDGLLDPAETPIGGSAAFSGDDGTVTFTTTGRTIAASGSEEWLLVYDITAGVSGGLAFEARVDSGGDVTARGAQTSQSVPVTGTPVQGNTVTTESPLLQTATFQDVNENGLLDTGDKVTVAFSQEVTIQGTPFADSVFLLDPAGTFGAAVRVTAGGSPTEVEILLEADSLLQPNGLYGTDAGSSGVNLDPAQVGLIDCAASPVQPIAQSVDVEGEVNPRITSVQYLDSNQNCRLDVGDGLQAAFTSPVTLTTANPALAFQLPVASDDFGSGAQFQGGGMPVGVSTVTIEVGPGSVLELMGTFDLGTLAAGSPSGLDVAAATGFVVDASNLGVSALPNVPAGLDIPEPSPELPRWFSEGWTTDFYHGTSIASAGDVDGDGFLDVIVGGPEDYFTGMNSGSAWLYSGNGGGLSMTDSWMNWGENSFQTDSRFGWSVASAGDVNGDLYDDIIVGAPVYDSIPMRFPWRFPEREPNDTFATATEGFMNWEDVEFDSSDIGGPGDVDYYLFHYDSPFRPDADVTVELFGGIDCVLTLYDANENFIATSSGSCAITIPPPALGSFYALVEDALNVGGPYTLVAYVPWRMDVGEAYLFLGGPSGPSWVADWSSLGDDQPNANFGVSVASAGDVDNDGFSDIVVASAGKTFLFRGSAGGLSAAPDWTAPVGEVVASAGNVNGDLYDDVIISQPQDVYVYLGSATGLLPSADWTSTGEGQGWFGRAIASAGDVNNDSFDDIIVGAESFNAGSGGEGKAYAYLGSATGLDTAASWWSSGNAIPGARFGTSVASAGDVNNDGFADVIVGAPDDDLVGSSTGRAYVFLGGPSGLSMTWAWESAGPEEAGSQFGASVASAGDLYLNGFANVLVGAPLYGSSDAGRAYLYCITE